MIVAPDRDTPGHQRQHLTDPHRKAPWNGCLIRDEHDRLRSKPLDHRITTPPMIKAEAITAGL
jgi:hypothetical protein